MAFVHAVMCARVPSPDHHLPASSARASAAAGRQPGRARLSRDIRAPPSYDLNARARGGAGPPQTHACALECPRSIMSWRSRERERERGRAAAGQGAACPSHVAPCSRRDRRGGAHVRACCGVAFHSHSNLPRAPPCSAHFIGPWPSTQRSGGGEDERASAPAQHSEIMVAA